MKYIISMEFQNFTWNEIKLYELNKIKKINWKLFVKLNWVYLFVEKYWFFLFLMIIWNEIELSLMSWWKIVKRRWKWIKVMNYFISHWVIFILMLNSFWDKHGSVLLIFLDDNDLFIEFLRVSENKNEITKNKKCFIFVLFGRSDNFSKISITKKNMFIIFKI